MKVLLLNPPGRHIYIRDYFCSKTSQANYINHPIDFLILSGILAQEHEVFLMDAIIDKISPLKCVENITTINPDVIIFLTGAASWMEDLPFLKYLLSKLKKEIKLIGLGDNLRSNFSFYFQKLKGLNAILLDFTTDDILKFLNCDYSYFKNIVFSINGDIKEVITKQFNEEFEIPVPKHELFVFKNYRYPFVRSNRFATVLSEYGCPFKCSFCIIGALGYKYRKLQNLLDELNYVRSLGINEIFFITQTFGANRRFAFDLCKAISGLGLKWFTFSRVDVLNEELLILMKKSGCHTIIFGIESGSDFILAKYRKGYTKQQVFDKINFCKKIGIMTVGTFIFGLPEDSHRTMFETLQFLKHLPLDYASFNVAVPRAGTDLRSEAIRENLIDENFITMDQSGTPVAMRTKFISSDSVLSYRRRAVFYFYFNPLRIFRIIIKRFSFFEFINQLENLIWLIRKTWMSNRKKLEVEI